MEVAAEKCRFEPPHLMGDPIELLALDVFARHVKVISPM
jgi:hypothetical protein